MTGAVPGYPLIERAIAASRGTIGRVPYPESTGPGLFTALAEDDADLVRFAPEVFYPYLWYERDRRGERFPRAYAVHHWAMSWTETQEGT